MFAVGDCVAHEEAINAIQYGGGYIIDLSDGGGGRDLHGWEEVGGHEYRHTCLQTSPGSIGLLLWQVQRLIQSC